MNRRVHPLIVGSLLLQRGAGGNEERTDANAPRAGLMAYFMELDYPDHDV